MGCLSAILFGAVQPVYAFAMGSMISVFFSPEHEEIKKNTRNQEKNQNIFALFRWIGRVLPPGKHQPTLQFCSQQNHESCETQQH